MVSGSLFKLVPKSFDMALVFDSFLFFRSEQMFYLLCVQALAHWMMFHIVRHVAYPQKAESEKANS